MLLLSRLIVAIALLACGGAATDAAGEAFLADNAKKEDVVVLPSGLQYRIIKSGPEGAPSPSSDTPCDCHYRGTLIDGTQFDSSYDRGEPTKFAPNQVIAGWTEAMQIMREGDKWELFLPSELAYGESGSGRKIKGGNALVFLMEIVKVRTGDSTGKMSTLVDSLTKNLFVVPYLGFIVRLWHVLAIYLFLTLGGPKWIFGKGGGKRVSASHILVKDKALCEKIKGEIAASKDPAAAFVKAAGQHSTCPSGKKGGSLGTFGQGQMVPEFDKVCFGECPIGEVQGPIDTQFGHHLIIVTERTDPEEKPKQK